ncbi:MAG: hypothetical protein GTO41_09160 [Burkholderiales bacterium]|nr:hypothetical protein [Burkholderiales bacterium]
MQSKTPRPGWVTSIAALVLLALTLYASYWQFGRAGSKAQSHQQYLARQAMPPLTLNSSIPGNDAVAYRKVRVTGKYVPEKAILLDNKVREGSAGYEIIVPLEIPGTSRHVLVNRGWVAGGRDRTMQPAIDVPGGIVVVTGTAVVPGPGALQLSEHVIEGRVWQNLDVARFRERQKLHVLDFVVQEESDRDDGVRRDWPSPGFGIEIHQLYAVQWLLFAVLIVFFYIYYGFVRKKLDK